MTSRMLGVSLGAALILLLLIIGGFWASDLGDCHNFAAGTITTPTGNIHIAVATTQIEQAHGLAGCKSLPKRSGMYFPYSPKTTPTFWMKGMFIPIDIIWIADNKVVKVDAFVPPPATHRLDEELTRYPAPTAVDGVLEVAAGKAQEYGLTKGVSIKIQQATK